MAAVRLEKYLADAGCGSRSQIKALLKQGRVSVDGSIEKDGSRRENYAQHEVRLNGSVVSYEEYVYYLLNKPQGVVSATRDNLSDTVIGLLDRVNTKGLFPVGRLDKDTEGLLLITNDGELAHNLLSPKKHVAKKYYVNLDKALSEEDRTRIEEGIDIGDEKPCLPARIERLEDAGKPDDFSCMITITEGRYHQVKRMFEACGLKVTFLKRISMGNLTLPETLNPGEFIKINRSDIL